MRVVDDDAALAVQPGALGQRDVGADADRHHHQVGGELVAVLEAHAPATRSLADDRLRSARLQQELAARAPPATLLQQPAGGLVELALHQPVAAGARRSPPCRAACRPLAASSPSRPPPITTACR